MKKNISIKFLSGILILTSVLGCESLEQNHERVIRPVVKGIETKAGPVITTSVLETQAQFIVEAVLDADGHNPDNSRVPRGRYFLDYARYNVDDWDLVNDHFWVNEVNTRFWCWNEEPISTCLHPSYPLNLEEMAGQSTRSFTFAVPELSNDRYDVVLAYASKTWIESNNDDTIDFTFHHPLANIRFKRGTIADAMGIVSITLKNVKKNGTFDFTGDGNGSGSFSWRDLSNIGDITETCTKATLESTNFFIPPQNTDRIILSVVFSTGTGNVTREINVSDATHTFAADTYYSFEINAEQFQNNPIVFTVNLEAWQAETGIEINPNA